MTDDNIDVDEGGESACFAHLICPECGTVLDGSAHDPECAGWDSNRGPNPARRLEPGSNN